MPSAFITFEGPEGSGKSTQAGFLTEALNEHGFKVKLTREPGGDPVSEEIRKIILDGSDNSITDRTELLLYESARAQHCERIVRPHLDAGEIVICDRFTDSTVAYQGYGNGLEIALINRLNDFATGGLKPDLTFLLDVDVSLGLNRQGDWNRMERKEIDFHQRVRHGFLEEAAKARKRIAVIDASSDIQTIREQIMTEVAERLGIDLRQCEGGMP